MSGDPRVGESPRLQPRTRRLIWVGLGVALVALGVILATMLSVEAERTQVLTLLPGGTPTGGHLYARNSSFHFSTSEPGLLSGSWGIYVPFGWQEPATPLYPGNECTATNYSYPGPTCSGPPLWQTPVGASSGSPNLTISAVSYTLAFIGQNSTQNPLAEVSTPFVLTPTPWWWI